MGHCRAFINCICPRAHLEIRACSLAEDMVKGDRFIWIFQVIRYISRDFVYFYKNTVSVFRFVYLRGGGVGASLQPAKMVLSFYQLGNSI